MAAEALMSEVLEAARWCKLLTPNLPGWCMQVWVPLMTWYVENRRTMEEQVKKYSDPPSEHLLPDLPPHAR